jgi:hypothetical protein
MPWRLDGGRANHTSVLFARPVAMPEREKAQINVDGVTSRQRCGAALVVAAVFGFLLVSLALPLLD